MAFTGKKAQLPVGRYGLNKIQNSLVRPVGTLQKAEGITIEDGVVRKEAGISRFGTTTISAFVREAYATYGSPVLMQGGIAAYKGTAITFDQLIGKGHFSSPGYEVTITVPAGGIPAGKSIVVCAAFLQSNLMTRPAGLSVRDSVNNRYTYSLDTSSTVYLGYDPGNPWMYIAIAVAYNVTALAAGQWIKVTTNQPLAKELACIAAQFTGLPASGALEATKWGHGTRYVGYGPYKQEVKSGPLAPATVLPQLLIGVVGMHEEQNSVTWQNSFSSVAYDGTAVHYHMINGITVAMGYRVDVGSLDNIVAIHDWQPSATVQRLLTGSLAGVLYKEVDGNLTAVSIKTGLSTSLKRGRWISGGIVGRRAFYCNGYNVVQMFLGDGTSTSDLTSPPADWSGNNQPNNLALIEGRLAGMGNANNPHRLYLSNPEDHADFLGASASQFYIEPGVGYKLVTALQVDQNTWLFKWPRGILYFDTSNADITKWRARKRTDALGVADSPWAALLMDNDIMFLSSDCSFHLLSAVREGPVTLDSDLGYRLGISKWLKDNVNYDKLDMCLSVWYAHEKTAIWSLCSKGKTENNLMLYFRFGDPGELPQFFYSFRDQPEALGLRRDSDNIERPIMAQAGKVYKLGQVKCNRDGAAYMAKYRTQDEDLRYIDPAYATLEKNWSFVELHQTEMSDPFSLISAPSLQATLSSAATSAALLAAFKGSTEIVWHRTMYSIGGDASSHLYFTITAASAAGSTVFVCLFFGNLTGAISAVSDDAGNTYTEQVTYHAASFGTLTIWACPNANAVAVGKIITVTVSSALNRFAAIVLEFSGLNATSILDMSVGGHALTATTAVDTGVGNPCSGVPRLFLGLVSYDHATASIAWTDPFTLLKFQDSGANTDLHVGFYIQAVPFTNMDVYLDRVLTERLQFRQDRRRQRRPLHGSSVEISLEVWNDQENETLSVVDQWVYFNPGGEPS